MKRNIHCYLIIVVFIIHILLFAGCRHNSTANDTTDRTLDEFYNMEDFSSIIIGESTAQDVYTIAPNITTGQMTSYGYIVEYPTEGGKYIHIKFYGEERIVGAIEEVLEPLKVAAKEFYSLEDFKSIVIGESTTQDVFKVAPSNTLYAVSYGAFCEYPMEDGRCIRIKFYGPEMIVGAIEVRERKTGDGSVVPGADRPAG